MGLVDVKYGKREISKGWRSIKVTSYKPFGASKNCPFPVGWTQQMKKQSIKEANVRTILCWIFFYTVSSTGNVKGICETLIVAW